MRTRGRLLFCAGVAACLLPAPLSAQDETFGPSTRYLALVAGYTAGEHAAAVEAIGDWTEKELRDQLAMVNGSAELVRRCAAPAYLARHTKACFAAKTVVDPLPLRAAALLHADRDAFERAERAGGAASCWYGFHADLASWFAELAPLQPDGQSFARRFSLARVLEAQSSGCVLAAQRWAEAGLKLAPRDGPLNLALGIANEAIASVTVPPERRLWEHARAALEQALAADATLHEARLHLGRVLWRLERKGAREAFEGVLSASREPRLLYLAHLFLGRLHEEDGQLGRAEAEYRAALGIDPTAQAAAVALSFVLQLAGRPEASRDTLREALRQAPRYGEAEPHWAYLTPPPSRGRRLFDELRQELQP
jgi:tetratricopeptide (TPR) repeat protein